MEQAKKVALIDADSLTYIVAWNHKDSIPSLVAQSCDSLVNSILEKTGATHYFGSFSSDKNFRHDIYKVAPYKGNRPPKPDWVREWERWIKDHLVRKWNFIEPASLEADDVIAHLALASSPLEECVICSPDKDMKQVPGLHYDYKVTENGIIEVSTQQAEKNFWLQMLTGDDTDNLKGVPGIGEVKAEKLLKGLDAFDMHMAVYEAYCKYYGDYYGDIIYKETESCIQLMGPTHTFYPAAAKYLDSIKELGFYPVPKETQDWPEI